MIKTNYFLNKRYATIHTNQTGKLNEIKEKPFKLEKLIQKVFELKMFTVMGLLLVKSEFTIKTNLMKFWHIMHKFVLI